MPKPIRLDPFHPDADIVARAAEHIRNGRLVAFPTETVYGLGANALSEHAVRRVFEAKGRPPYNPLITHLPDAAAAQELVTEWPQRARVLAAAFWPGPLTLVLPKRSHIPDLVTAGLPTLGLRVPAHPVALALLRACDLPVAAPSANPFTAISPTTAEHVHNGLGDRVDLILDGGATTIGIESTVLDVGGDRPTLLRLGAVTREDIEHTLGEPVLLASGPGDGQVARRGPGMLQRHYAPRARTHVFGARERHDAAGLVAAERGKGHVVGALLLDTLDAPVHHPIAMPAEAVAYARLLYAALHSLDEQRCDLILIEEVPHAAEWNAVADRIRRATAP